MYLPSLKAKQNSREIPVNLKSYNELNFFNFNNLEVIVNYLFPTSIEVNSI